MRVVLSTISKFHTLDLARQLERRGVLERIFTGRPRWKLRGEQLPSEKVSTFPYLQTIFEGLGHVGVQRYPLKTELNWLAHITLDKYVAGRMPECDVFHALAYCGLQSGRKAQATGAAWICDVVNAHPVFMDEILAEEHALLRLTYDRQDQRFLRYADRSYEEADLLTVPSTFVKDTLVARGIPESKVSIVPYGVDLCRFGPVDVAPRGGFTVLYVGQLSVLKGIHYLIDAFRLAGIPESSLLLVGPSQPVTHSILEKHAQGLPVSIIGAQPKTALSRYYSSADVMVFPSICDASGLVIGEALACGCPVIATENSGARDLFTDGVEGFVVPIRSPQAIADKLVWLHDHPQQREDMKRAALNRVHQIGGWDDYGDHMLEVFETVASARK